MTLFFSSGKSLNFHQQKIKRGPSCTGKALQCLFRALGGVGCEPWSLLCHPPCSLKVSTEQGVCASGLRLLHIWLWTAPWGLETPPPLSHRREAEAARVAGHHTLSSRDGSPLVEVHTLPEMQGTFCFVFQKFHLTVKLVFHFSLHLNQLNNYRSLILHPKLFLDVLRFVS